MWLDFFYLFFCDSEIGVLVNFDIDLDLDREGER